MIATGLSQSQVQNLVQQRLIALRNALDDVQKLYGWTSGLSPADLSTASGWSTGDATGVQAAVADANGLAIIAQTGTDPRNPGANYVYLASIRGVVGPQ